MLCATRLPIPTDSPHARRRATLPSAARRWAIVILIHLAGGALGFLLSRLHVPLAWMVGSLLLTGAFSATTDLPRLPLMPRRLGQLIVSGVVGLYVTPEALHSLWVSLVPMIAASVAVILLSVPIAAMLGWFGRVETATALFAALPGGPVEMAQLAERYGGQGGLVALTQTLRIAAIVLVIPPFLKLLGHELPDVTTIERHVNLPGLGLLYLAAIAGGFAFQFGRITNAFFLGPVVSVGLLSVLGVPLSDVPGPLVAFGQILLGTSLGAMFNREVIQSSRAFVLVALVTTAILIASTLLLAMVLWLLDVAPFETLALATAPGSVTEMAITASSMHLEVSLVAAFHVTRIFIIIPNATLIFHAFRRVLEGLLPKRD